MAASSVFEMPFLHRRRRWLQEWKCCTCGKTETDKGPQGRKHLLMALKTHWQQAILMLKARGTLKTRSECSSDLLLHGACPQHLGCSAQGIHRREVRPGSAAGHQQAQPQFETLLSKSPGTLHPLHALQIDCLMPLVNCCRARQDHQVLQ